MSAVAIIPARGGSKRIPRKNIRSFFGKPIIAYSIEAAISSGLFDAGVWVSTEDEEIAAVAEKHGAIWLPRPPELAEVDAPDPGTQEVTRHALKWLAEHGSTPAYACCIYPCAPLMRVDDLRGCMAACFSDRCAYTYTVCGWRDAGTLYGGAAAAFMERIPLDHWSTIRYDIERERFCDIDTEEDWQRACRLYAEMIGRKTL